MNPTAYNGRGSQLQYSLDGVNWMEVRQIQKFKPSGSKQIMVDQTNLSSPGMFTQPYPVQVDAGEIDFAGILNPQDPTYLALGQFHGQGTILSWRVRLVDGTFYGFQASVSELVPFDVETKKANAWSGKLRLIGGMESPLSAFQPTAFDPNAFQIVLM